MPIGKPSGAFPTRPTRMHGWGYSSAVSICRTRRIRTCARRSGSRRGFEPTSMWPSAPRSPTPGASTKRSRNMPRCSRRTRRTRLLGTIAPTHLYARRRLATTLRRVGRAKEAAELFEEVLQQTPADSEVHLELGDLYFMALHDRPRARAHYGAVLRYAPDHPRAGEIRERLAGNHSAGSSGPS